MWKIKEIRQLEAEDEWLRESALTEGSVWPDAGIHHGRYNEPGADGKDAYQIVKKAREHIQNLKKSESEE